MKKLLGLASVISCLISTGVTAETQLLWGDTHLHTAFSPDAYFLGNRSADPHAAYRFAKGLPIVNAKTRARVQINTPLDFLVVSDHAEMMGVPYRLFKGDPSLTGTDIGRRYISMIKQGKGVEVFTEFLGSINNNISIPEFDTPDIRSTIWKTSTDIAEHYNEPGKFTTLIGWEWTSTPDGNNLHRVIFSAQDAKAAQQYVPYSSLDSNKPEKLWDWLTTTSSKYNTDFVSIPHNSNISGGLMFATQDSEGRNITADYARTRMRWEPVVEATQIKGDSETHALLSPGDEFATFESYRHLLSVKPDSKPASITEADYVRSALKVGLEQEAGLGVNPFKFGLVGSSDAHTGQGAAEENNFAGKISRFGKPEDLDETTTATATNVTGWDFSASGLAAVWAEDNTREAIFAAFKRKEVYATTGTRIGLRFFGGWDFKKRDTANKNLAAVGYKKGISMGGDLSAAPKKKSPSFLIHAVKDPSGANLDRVQVIKGYLDNNGKAQEHVYNVAASRSIEKDGSVSAVENSVDIKTGQYSNTEGSAELTTVWTDPNFNAAQRAFYYVRVLEIPTPRHTLYDAIALQKEHPKTQATSIQERAYSSPIWYTPASN